LHYDIYSCQTTPNLKQVSAASTPGSSTEAAVSTVTVSPIEAASSTEAPSATETFSTSEAIPTSEIASSTEAPVETFSSEGNYHIQDKLSRNP